MVNRLILAANMSSPSFPLERAYVLPLAIYWRIEGFRLAVASNFVAPIE